MLMNKGSVIVDISSNSAYVLPKFLISRKVYALAETDEELFVKKLVKKSNLAKGEYQKSGFAIATVADERNGYLAGVDVLCDGGCTNGKMFKK